MKQSDTTEHVRPSSITRRGLEMMRQKQLGSDQRPATAEMIGSSERYLEMLDMIERVARTESTVLITGETGTGKELVARAIHAGSHRAAEPLVALNCGSVSEHLLESKLFGHVKGAFTSAICDRKGVFSIASGGTLFLDEIGDMSPSLQVKLLRVLQEGTFEPVGSSVTQTTDVRIVAATHRDLERRIDEKLFREDLFYRINIFPIEVPALRHRKTDIEMLSMHFLKTANECYGLNISSIAQEALNRLIAYTWPGNIRELENVVERIAVLAGSGDVSSADLPPSILHPVLSHPTIHFKLGMDGINLNETIINVERDLIQQALDRSDWDKKRAAGLLGIKRTTLLDKIKRMKIEPPTSETMPSSPIVRLSPPVRVKVDGLF
jgi:transcriptional regulator with GAF, ATPase, and Fis domain